LQAPQWRIDALAMAFVGLRIVYVAAYVKNLANLRSLVWVLALLANIGLLFAGMA
jgi:uncharacterized MAPEG superfamily protein